MRLLYISILMLLTAATLVAQDKPDLDRRADRLEAKKIAYITTELDLSPSESQQFWPLYNEYQNKVKANKKDLRQRSTKAELDQMTESEAKSLMAAMLETEKQEYELKKEYTDKLSEVVPVRKIVKLFVLERKFRDEVVRSIKQKMKRRDKRGFRNE